jgi:hypothetical protein
MIWIDHPLMFWLMAAIPVIGLFSLALTRVGENTTACCLCRSVFFVSLLLVGLATMLSAVSGLGQWAVGGATLSLMVVGSTLDLRDNSTRHVMY